MKPTEKTTNLLWVLLFIAFFHFLGGWLFIDHRFKFDGTISSSLFIVAIVLFVFLFLKWLKFVFSKQKKTSSPHVTLFGQSVLIILSILDIALLLIGLILANFGS
jgi:hypothetical protein